MTATTALVDPRLAIEAILALPLPRFHARVVSWSAETRAFAITRLFDSLGVAIEAGALNMALDFRAVYVALPSVGHFAPAGEKTHRPAKCPTCVRRAAAKAHVRAMILAAWPDFEAAERFESTERFESRLHIV